MKIDVEVKGLEHLKDVLTRELPKKAHRKVIQKSLRISAQPMLRAARASAARSSGALAESIRTWNVIANRRREKTFATVHLGPKRSWKKSIALVSSHYGRSFKVNRLGIYHGHIIEFGSKNQPAKAYLGPAMASHGQSMIKDFGSIMAGEIEREAIRLKRKQRK